ADYWLANVRNPVRFSQAVAAAGADHSNFIEISPHPLLTHAITETLGALTPSRAVHVGPTVNRDNPETLTFHTQLATLRPSPEAIAQADSATGRLVDIPPTPWVHTKYWMANNS